MEYQVWTHDEYEGWRKVDCADRKAAQGEIMKAIASGKAPLLTVAIPYELNINVKEDKIGEAIKSKAQPGKSPGAEGEGEVRPGDATPVPELDKGSGDPGAGDLLPNQ